MLNQIDEMLLSAMATHAWPGLCVGIVRHGRVIYARGFGVATINGSEAVTPSTVFRMGSIAKTLTAVGIMQLWEQGRFQLDDPVNDYLKGYRVAHKDPAAPAVTVRHLLTHTSGIGALRRYSDMLHPTGHLTVKQGQPLPALQEYYAPILRPEVYPGSTFAYTNHGFATLGQLIADISGQPFAQYMIDHVFDPLGMTRTDYLCSERVLDHVATAHKTRRGKLVAAPHLGIVPGPAGALYSSVEDMARYLSALLCGGAHQSGAVLSPQTLQLMLTPQLGRDPRLPTMGLGFILQMMGGHRLVGHDGGIPWFTSSLTLAPDDGVGIIAAINTFDGALVALAKDLLRVLLALPDQSHRLPRPDVAESPHLWPELCGSYGPQKGLLTNLRFWGTWGGEVEVCVRDGHLNMHALLPHADGQHGPGVRLYPVDRHDPLFFRGSEPGEAPAVLFHRGSGGRVDGMEVGLLFALSKRSGLKSLRMQLRLLAGGLVCALSVAVARHKRRGGTARTGIRRAKDI